MDDIDDPFVKFQKRKKTSVSSNWGVMKRKLR